MLNLLFKIEFYMLTFISQNSKSHLKNILSINVYLSTAFVIH